MERFFGVRINREERGHMLRLVCVAVAVSLAAALTAGALIASVVP
jgi:hypothetical protein